jgi:hypothetical protein
MPNVNLSTQTYSSGDGFSFSGGGFFGAMVILILVLGLWGGLVFWGNIIAGEAKKTEEVYNQKYEDFTRRDAKEAVDFKNRLDFARDYNGTSASIKETLDNIEKSLLKSEVWLGSYKYDEKIRTVIVSCRAKNYRLVAEQILSFKKSDYFSSVSGGKTQMDKTNGVISFEVNLAIK